jgi:Family of unknown function (DUF5763)
MSGMRRITCILILLFFSLQSGGQVFYKTPSGKKYHTDSCRMVNNFSEAITIEKARQLGLQPCLICRPLNIYNGSTTASKTSGQAASVQCKGKTKAGTRCRHMTRIANGYCYQHQPE